MRQRQRGRARAHPLAEHGVETEVLERGIQRLLVHAVEPVDLVDEETVARGEIEEDRAKGALVVNRRTRRHLDGDAELVRDDVRERGLAESRWTAQQDMLDRLAAPACRLEQDAEIVADCLLADVFRQHSRPQREVELLVVRARIDHGVLVRHLRPRALRAVASASCVDGDAFQSTASSPTRASCDEKPRLRSADSTAFGTAPSPASAAARGMASSSPAASSFGFSSMITLAAVRWPTPVARRIGAASSLTIARLSTSRLAALRMFSPTLGPTPSTWMSISNKLSSSTDAKP